MNSARRDTGEMISRLVALLGFLAAAAFVAILRKPWVDMRLYCFAVLPLVTVQTMGFAFEWIKSDVTGKGDAPVPRSWNARFSSIAVAAALGRCTFLVSLLVVLWPVTPNIRIVYPLKSAEVSRFE